MRSTGAKRRLSWWTLRSRKSKTTSPSREYAAAARRRLFLEGMASVLDIAGTSYHPPTQHLSPEEEDRLALASDWEAVGRDLLDAAQALQSVPRQVEEQ